MSLLSFFIPCFPPNASAQMKGQRVIVPKDGSRPFVHHFKKQKVVRAESELMTLLRSYAPPAPFAGPLAVSITFIFPWRKSERKSVMAEYECYPVETKPDASNLVKTVEDVMGTLGFWGDDAQNAVICMGKFRGHRPGIAVDIKACPGVLKTVQVSDAHVVVPDPFNPVTVIIL